MYSLSTRPVTSSYPSIVSLPITHSTHIAKALRRTAFVLPSCSLLTRSCSLLTSPVPRPVHVLLYLVVFITQILHQVHIEDPSLGG
ncbi:hypothetical protein BDW42DRAFT_177666 [Aspergillus taichungensis]|uniref:Uncharacterized protein n=1 Tax=Aspergillus taichungensis TaxID=482145 RepID=A0A2J5HJ77_9EURO|nr:hypothetical protein BDW42DRAFT_177666 [Aspergillus taichungensis]